MALAVPVYHSLLVLLSYGGSTVTNSACSTTVNDAQTRATNYNTNNGNFN